MMYCIHPYIQYKPHESIWRAPVTAFRCNHHVPAFPFTWRLKGLIEQFIRMTWSALLKLEIRYQMSVGHREARPLWALAKACAWWPTRHTWQSLGFVRNDGSFALGAHISGPFSPVTDVCLMANCKSSLPHHLYPTNPPHHHPPSSPAAVTVTQD